MFGTRRLSAMGVDGQTRGIETRRMPKYDFAELEIAGIPIVLIFSGPRSEAGVVERLEKAALLRWPSSTRVICWETEGEKHVFSGAPVQVITQLQGMPFDQLQGMAAQELEA